MLQYTVDTMYFFIHTNVTLCEEMIFNVYEKNQLKCNEYLLRARHTAKSA